MTAQHKEQPKTQKLPLISKTNSMKRQNVWKK